MLDHAKLTTVKKSNGWSICNSLMAGLKAVWGWWIDELLQGVDQNALYFGN